MKVCTDSILFGSWIDAKLHRSILDVGTGNGLLSLMMAQKFPKAKITGLEIDFSSFCEAKLNFQNSEWSSRIKAIHCDAKIWNSFHKFDLIISNPPFFSHSLLSNQISKNISRHQIEFNLNELVQLWIRQGTRYSNLACILPVNQAEELIGVVNLVQGKLIKFTSIRGRSKNKPNRIMLMFSKEKAPISVSSICIYSSPNEYSKEFISLTKEFYINH